MTNRATVTLCAALLAALAGCSGGGGDACDTLLAGDLVITELLANPEGEDKGFEWFEVFNATGSALDLDGVEITASRTDGTDRNFHTIGNLRVAAGGYVVLGNATAELPGHVHYGFGTGLGDFRNSGGRLALECGGAIIDAMVWGDTESGASLGFDGDRAPDALANDDVNAWCTATTTLVTIEDGEDLLGSPGAANEPCEGGVTPGTCMDGTIERQPVAPFLGDLVINEFMANPYNVDDKDGEWFEVLVNTAVDLNGLQIGQLVADDPKMTLSDETCLTVTAGSYVLFARKDDPLVNGGLPAVDFTLPSFQISNTNKGLYLAVGGVVLDQIAYKSTAEGKSTALDPANADPAQNDDPENWCPGVDGYGSGDLGTPGDANPVCQ
ncbi:MAG: lamin tail domain-containing protein [Deltaproteobacteria bacterium]|nr:lamin tail domain-containing protein [Deltaproteobacteria bacterium]